MPVDDQEGRSHEPAPEAHDPAPATDARGESSGAGGGSGAPAPRTRLGWRRRYVTRRNALLTGVLLVAGVVLLVAVAVLLYRTGQVDSLIERQIKQTLAEYNIRADIHGFRTRLGPRTAELTGVDLYDATTGEQLGHADRLLATVRVEDMWALSLRRNVNLEALEIDGLKLWVKFDEQGRSNFRNIHLPPEDKNRRIVFSYATAHVTLKDATVYYGDAKHELSGVARNLRATIAPDDESAPASSQMNRVTVAFDNSTLTYDGRPGREVQSRGADQLRRARRRKHPPEEPERQRQRHGRRRRAELQRAGSRRRGFAHGGRLRLERRPATRRRDGHGL
ncbi:MAG: hypothetical protein LC746_00610 [Acidobacteria bacterium]|nr:hypothetical protein [Acidobacteriota bacterium]